MKRTTKSVTVDVPELSDLQLDPVVSVQLSTICSNIRATSDKIKKLETDKGSDSEALKALLAQLPAMPDRTLGPDWDLRRTTRSIETFSTDRLKMALLQLGFEMVVDCPSTQLSETGDIIVCPNCNGSGRVKLIGLPAILCLVDQCTDRSTSSSWSVYGRQRKPVKS